MRCLRHLDMDARQHDLVLPAGFPHRNWNAAPDQERRLAFLVPPVTSDQSLNRFVDYSLTEHTLRLPDPEPAAD